MKYMTINKIVFFEDSNMKINISYEDMHGRNIDLFVLKHIVKGSTPKSFVVKNTKYFIKDVDRTGIKRHPAESTTGKSTGDINDRFLPKVKGRIADSKKDYHMKTDTDEISGKINMIGSYKGPGYSTMYNAIGGHEPLAETVKIELGLDRPGRAAVVELLKNIKGDTDGD